MRFKLKALERLQSRDNSVPVPHHTVNTSGRIFALAEIRACPLSTLEVADVQISASLSRVPPLAELNEMVQYLDTRTLNRWPLQAPIREYQSLVRIATY